MPRPIPADLEDALSAAPAARERFWSLPPERVDEWIGWVESARMPRTRRRRVAETVQRLNGRPQAAETVVQTNGAGPAALPPRESPWLWFLAVALLILIAALVYFFAVRDRSSGSASKVTVPRVIGLKKQAAQFELRQENLTSTVVTRAAAKPQGIVVGQTPDSGSSVSRGTPVTLVVSAGAPGVALPSVVGLTAVDATKQLQALKLRPTTKPVASTKPAGTVLAQTPAAGAKAKSGSAVVLSVAQAKQKVAVPSVTGQTLQAATATLTQAGLSATVAQVPSKQPKGTVVAQRPAAGQKTAKGSGVRLNVSKGSGAAPTTTPQSTTTQRTTTTRQATTTTPGGTQSSLPPAPPQGAGNDYRGMQLSNAVQQIADGRQQAVVLYVASSKPAGIVVSNGTVGSKMRLAVSAGPNPGAPTDLPDVSGEDGSQAQSDLQAAGFTAITVQWPVSDASKNGLVVEETPVGGAQRPHGVAIVLYVGTSP